MSSRLVLASGSASRRAMLEGAGVPFEVRVPQLDEERLKASLLRQGIGPRRLAPALAEAKARAGSEQCPGALVLGGDQVLHCEGRIFGKAADIEGARETLLALRGRTHELISAAALGRNGELLWCQSASARLSVRSFSNAFLDSYLKSEARSILGSVGCYRIEGRGVQLFSEVIGDQFVIRGLPLLQVLGALRDQGVLDS